MPYTLSVREKIPLIALILSSLVYVVFSFIFTFTTHKLNFLSEIYIDGLQSAKKSNYYNTLFASTIFSAILPILLLLLLFHHIAGTDSKAYRNFVITLYTVGLFGLIAFLILLLIFSDSEKIFTSKNNIEYNYPAFLIIAFLIVYIITGSFYFSENNKIQ